MAPKVCLQRRSSGLRTSICSCRMRKRRCPMTAADHIDSCRPTHCEHTFSETRPSGASSINDFAHYILNVRLCKACQSCSVMVWSLNPAGPIPITLAHDFDNDALKELSWWCPNQQAGDAKVRLQAFRRIPLTLTGKCLLPINSKSRRF